MKKWYTQPPLKWGAEAHPGLLNNWERLSALIKLPINYKLINFQASAYNCVTCIPFLISSPISRISSKNAMVRSKFARFSSPVCKNFELEKKKARFLILSPFFTVSSEFNSKRFGLLAQIFIFSNFTFFLIENGNADSHLSWQRRGRSPKSMLTQLA